MPQPQMEPWGGEVRLPSIVRWMLRKPAPPGDTPERAHERRRPEDSGVTPLENAHRAALGGFSDIVGGDRPRRH